MIGGGTFLSPLIRIVVTVAILAAVYFFIVKPVLETTENVSDNVSQSFEGFDDVGPSIQQSFEQAEKISENAQANSNAQVKEANKLLDCITEAAGDVNQIQRCNEKFDPANP